MGLLDRLLGGREALAIRSGSWPLSQTPGQLFNLRTSGAGVIVDQDSAMSLSAVFAAVNKLSSITAALPLSVYRSDGKNREVADANKAQRLLHTEFNPDMSAFIGRRTAEFHRLLWGRSCIEISWSGAGQPYALYPLEPWRFVMKRDGEGQLYLEVDGGKRRLQMQDVIYETLISRDGICGESFIDYAVGSLGLSIAAQTFSERFFGNDARPGGILTHELNPPKEQREEMRQSWQRHHEGPDKAFKTGVIWGGWKYTAESGAISPEDSQLLDVRKFSTEEVSRWLNVPPHILYDLDRSTNNNIEHQGIEFIQHSLGPTLIQKEQEIDRKLLNPPKLYSKHNVAALLRGDSTARADYYAKLIGIGVMNVNEARDLEDLNPIGSDGDVHFVPVNMQPIEKAIHPPEPPPPAIPPENPPPEPPADNAPAMRAALRSLLTDTFARLQRKELNEGRRAAKRPGEFLAWIDGFYPEFEATLCVALRDPLRVLDAAQGMTSLRPSVVSGEYVSRSREALLEAAGSATAAKLAAVVEELFREWEPSRPADEAARILGEEQ
jgi:HK97 family phage portal protein